MSIIDNKWREHLAEMDYLRAGIGLRAMGQRDPLTEYQREGYEMFSELVMSVKRDALRYLFHVEVTQSQPAPQQPRRILTSAGGSTTRQASSAKVGRNAPCPCGSGQKAKKCSNTPECLGSKVS